MGHQSSGSIENIGKIFGRLRAPIFLRTVGTLSVMGLIAPGCGFDQKDQQVPVSITAIEREAQREHEKDWVEQYLKHEAAFPSGEIDEVYQLSRHIRVRYLYGAVRRWNLPNDEDFLARLGESGTFQIYDENANPINYLPNDVFELYVLRIDKDVLLRPKPPEALSTSRIEKYHRDFEQTARYDVQRVKIEATNLREVVDLATAELPPDSNPEEIAELALSKLP